MRKGGHKTTGSGLPETGSRSPRPPARGGRTTTPSLERLHRRDLLFELFHAQLDILGRDRLLRLLFGGLGPGLLVVLDHDSARFREGRGWNVGSGYLWPGMILA